MGSEQGLVLDQKKLAEDCCISRIDQELEA